MVRAPTRRGGIGNKRLSFYDMAEALYPDGRQADDETGGAQDSQDWAADTPDDKSGEDAASATRMQNMADSLYPEGSDNEENDSGEDGSDGSAPQTDEPGDEGRDAESVDGDKPPDGDGGLTAQNAADRLHAVLQGAGIDPSAKLSEKDAAGAAKLEGMLRSAIAGEEAKKGGPLTGAEEQNFTEEFIADHALKWLRLRKIAADKLSDTMWKDAGGKANASCGIFFRKHLEALGGDLSSRKSGAAKDWGPALEKNGYERVSMENYQPEDGDVRIFGSVVPKDPKNPKPAELYGHIQVYNAKQKRWVSEYQQVQDIPPVFQRKDAKYVTYRFNPF